MILYRQMLQSIPATAGGPLLNINGELIGINTAIYAKAQGIGFAIPINKAKRIIGNLIQYGEVIQPWIGITVQDIDSRLGQYLSRSQTREGNMGVLVREIQSGSPADKAGIREGDIILSVGGTDIYSSDDYHMAVRSFAAGDTVKTEIWRSGRKETAFIKTAAFPVELAGELAYNLLGIKVENVRAKQGAVISEIRTQSYLARIGARRGDIIRQIDEMTIKDVRDFEKAIIKYRDKSSVVILLQRGDQGYYVTVDL
jgi:S1-C subfamily serine protease